MEQFKWEIIGGVLIALGSVIPYFFYSRVAGVSGYMASALNASKDTSGREALYFVLGLIVGGFVLSRYLGSFQGAGDFLATRGLLVVIIAGLLVGFGSRLGGGCTSGHGVCGMGRLSTRSFVAVGVFMSAAIGTVLLLRVWGL